MHHKVKRSVLQDYGEKCSMKIQKEWQETLNQGGVLKNDSKLTLSLISCYFVSGVVANKSEFSLDFYGD